MSNDNFYRIDPHALERLLAYCHRRHYHAKAPVIRPRDPATTLYYIVDGAVTVSVEDEDGRELILAYLNAGDFIGEVGIFMKTDRRDVMVRTRVETEMAEITYERLRALCETDLADVYPQILYGLACQLTRRLVHTSRTVSRLAFLDVSGRVARTLLDLCEQPEALEHPEGAEIQITRQEISRIVGCSREMVGRVLKGLEDNGTIVTAGKSIVVRRGEYRSANHMTKPPGGVERRGGARRPF